MPSLFRDINSTARAFCTTKNELLVVMALSNQTIGYGKTSDPLTDKRLAKITGIRLDRLRPAVNAVIEKGLFDRKPHKRFGHEYSIGKDFLQAYPGKVYTPFISQNNTSSENQNPLCRNTNNLTQMGKVTTESQTPFPRKNSDLTQMGKPLTEKQRHTITKTNSYSPQQQTKTETKKTPSLNSQQQTVPLAEQQSVKLFFNDENDIPSRFAIETSSPNTRIEFSFGTSTTRKTESPKTETHMGETPTLSTPETTKTLKKIMHVAKTKPVTTIEKKPTTEEKTPAKPTTTRQAIANIPKEKCEPWVEDALAAADYLDRVEAEKERKAKEKQQINKAIDMTKPATKPVEKPIEPPLESPMPVKPSTPKKALIPLPKRVGEENYNACNRHFNMLDDELKKKLLLIFDYNFKTRKINNPAGYFITLAQTAIQEGLTVPPEAMVNQPPTPETIAAAKEKAYRTERWSDFAWLQQNAELQNMAVDALAKRMGGEIEEAYRMFAHILEAREVQKTDQLTKK